jgi:ABC-type antimicrobial peptide transport system permease subunit
MLVSREGVAGNLANDLLAAVRDVDPQLAVTVSTLEDNLGLWRGLSRLAATGSGVLAGLALVLSAIGAYGVVAFSVSRRVREIGIRLALGATNRDVVGLILRQTMRSVFIGVAAGTLCAAAIARLLSALLFGLSPYDPLSFTAVPLILFSIAALASYLPARRVTRVNPLIALRYE